MGTLPTWTPRAGDVVHLRFDCSPAFTGRYSLERRDGSPCFRIRSERTGKAHNWIAPSNLIKLHEDGALTPIDPRELERDRKALELRTLAPLRGRRPVAQSDVDGLALFDAHRSPKML